MRIVLPRCIRVGGVRLEWHLVAQLLAQGGVVREDLGGKEPLEHVMVPAMAVAPGGAQLARSRVRLGHRADGVRGRPNQR